MKTLFINDSSANQNWGSRATSFALKRALQCSGATIYQTVTLRELTYPTWQSSKRRKQVHSWLQHWRPSAEIPQKLMDVMLNRSILLLPDVIPATWQQFEPYAKELIKGRYLPDIQQALRDVELVFINGEGGIFAQRRESRAMFFLAYVAKQYFKKTVIFAGHTAELSHPNLLEIATHVYPLLDDVIFRDPLSAEQNKRLTNARLVPDITFTLTASPQLAWLELAKQETYYHHIPVTKGSLDPTKPYVCVGGSSAFTSPQLKQQATHNLHRLCQRLQQLHLGVVLVASANTDEDILLPIAEALSLPLIPVSTSFQQGIDILANASAYVGGRWHGGIFSLLGGTPIIMLAAETFKVNALMQQLAWDTSVYSIDDLENQQETIVEQVADAVAQGSHLRSTLKRKVKSLAEEARQNVILANHFTESLSRL